MQVPRFCNRQVFVKVSPCESLVPSGMVTSFTNETQSQYEAFVAVGGGVFVAGTDVAVAGSGVIVGRTDVWVGAFCVMAYMVCVTIAWTVANESFVACGCGFINGIANKVMGKQDITAIAIIPAITRVELVVSFIMHLLYVQEMDDD